MFVPRSKAKKNKSKKLLNLLTKPVQQKVKLVNKDQNIAGSVSDNDDSEDNHGDNDDSEDDHEDNDEDVTNVSGIPNFVILYTCYINIMNLFYR